MAQDSTTYVATARTDREPETTTGLLRRLGDDLATLVRKELALATAEVSRGVNEMKKGIVGIAAAGAILYAGFLVLLGSAVLALGMVMALWLAALIVGAVVGIIGFVMLQSARSKLEAANLKPERSQESLRRDKELLHRDKDIRDREIIREQDSTERRL
jgi:ABC-type multidrug transport system fused ATPase/permease subunit